MSKKNAARSAVGGMFVTSVLAIAPAQMLNAQAPTPYGAPISLEKYATGQRQCGH